MDFNGSEFLRNTLTFVLAGGQGSRLSPLTSVRSKPSVPFGGKYRIIDFALSNCLNSGLRKIYVLTQYKSDSLSQHLYEAWNIFNPELGEFIYSVPPQQKESNEWYQGTANAIYQNINMIKDRFKWVLILSGDHIYKMDYLKMLHTHVQTKADVSISSFNVPKDIAANQFGVLEVDSNFKVKSFIEKPSNPPTNPNNPNEALANMGIYIFDAKLLVEILEETHKSDQKSYDFGHDIIPYMIKNNFDLRSYMFKDENRSEKPYWVDVGTIDSYYAANMDLVKVKPEFDLYDPRWPLRSYLAQSPPAKTLSHEGERVGRALNSLICDGTVVSGGLVERSLIGPQSRINSYTYITDSIIMNNVNVGRHSRIRRAIIDKNVTIPENTEIGFDHDEDRKRFTVSETGIVIIPKDYVFK